MVDSVYNPTVVPLYIGIFATNIEKAKKDIINHAQYSLTQLAEKFTEDQQQIQQEHDSIVKSGFQFPQSIHITSLFIGNNNQNLDKNACFTSFKENLSIPIEVTCVAYVPGQILCGTCFPDEKQIRVQNKIPHLTMLIHGWPAMMSNTVLEAIMLDDKYLGQEYLNGTIEDSSEGAWKFENVEIQGKGKFTVFVVKIGKKLVIDGLTMANKGHGGGGKGQKGGKGKNK